MAVCQAKVRPAVQMDSFLINDLGTIPPSPLKFLPPRPIQNPEAVSIPVPLPGHLKNHR